jgi:hypothetical protein
MAAIAGPTNRQQHLGRTFSDLTGDEQYVSKRRQMNCEQLAEALGELPTTLDRDNGSGCSAKFIGACFPPTGRTLYR